MLGDLASKTIMGGHYVDLRSQLSIQVWAPKDLNVKRQGKTKKGPRGSPPASTFHSGGA